MPLWKEGFAYKVLGPPLPAKMFRKLGGGLTQVVRFELVAVAAQELFHGTSGIYPSADSLVNGAFAVEGAQKVDCVPASSKSVPPTAMLNGVDASPFTAIP